MYSVLWYGKLFATEKYYMNNSLHEVTTEWLDNNQRELRAV